jgi:NitT/TauT family transport system ATP-binding protein
LRNVTFGPELRDTPRKEAERNARDIIALVGLSGFENHYPHELSGGMRQRVNLARAFAVNPDILLMDEPFAALDALTREQMQQELVRIVAETGKTVIFVTHQIDEAVLLADRIAVLSARPGRIVRIVDVDLARPRTLDLKRTPEFHAVVEEVWNLIAQTHGLGNEEAKTHGIAP